MLARMQCILDIPVLDRNGDFTYDQNDHIITQQVTLLSGAETASILDAKYGTFAVDNQFYYAVDANTDTETVAFRINNYNEAVIQLATLWQEWMAEKRNAYSKLYSALYRNYQPLNNYDKTSKIITEYAGKETNTNTPTGTETETYTKDGKETNAQMGTTTTIDSVTSYDDVDFAQTNKSVVTPEGLKDELSFTNRTDTTQKTFTGRKTTDEKTFTDRTDTVTERTFGNVGVTTSQQMLESQFPIAEKDNMRLYVVNDFVHNNLVATDSDYMKEGKYYGNFIF